MKGSRCSCGYMTTSERRRCPKCGREMVSSEWPDMGKVLSFSDLDVVPEGLTEHYDMALVAVPKGPKLICWTSEKLKVKDEVAIEQRDGRYFCSLKKEPQFKLDEKTIRSG